MIIRICDLETTGVAPPAEPVELAFIDVDGQGRELARFQTLVKPRGPIPAEARAVHHIGDADVANAPAWGQAVLHIRVKYPAPNVWLAHNAAFEKQWLAPRLFSEPLQPVAPKEQATREGSEGEPRSVEDALPWICTLKAAYRIWPDAPQHSISALRYWLNLNVETSADMPAHRAMCDCAVTAELFRNILGTGAGLDNLIAWEREPALIPRISFGKHCGSKWEDVPLDYLKWMRTKNFDGDTAYCMRRELARRQGQMPPRKSLSEELDAIAAAGKDVVKEAGPPMSKRENNDDR